MKSSRKDFNEVNYLVELAMEGSITPEQSQLLNQLIVEDTVICRHYCEYVQLTVLIERLNAKIPASDLFENGMVFDENLWNQLALAEQIAPEIEIPAVPQSEQNEKPTEIKKVHPKVSKFSVFSLVLSSAALIFVIAYGTIVSMKRGVEVATLEDSLNAKWADSNPSMRNGTRLKTGSELLLIREGFATLVFDNDTRVVIEGPAEFQVLTGDQIKLNYGRIYAIVPPQAYGFQVTTPGTKIIDLGTEFGVQQDRHGNTELHVISGKTSLVAGIRGSRINAYVEAGSAKRLDTSIGQIKEIACDETLFVRRIDSQVNLVWRGEQTLDLADMVRNGNGLGTGNSKVRLNPFKGFTNEQHNDKRGFHYATAKEYLSITDHPFIDGIFIPNGDPNQIINSRGDVFDECPKTSGIFDRDLQANPEPGIFRLGRREGTIRFDGQEYSDQSGRSCIVMHANHGLTFDLDAIRKSYHRDINRFTSRIGIADLNEIYPCNADFYVLVDGKIRYSLKQYKQKGVLNDVSVEIKKTDRFLTLVVTDGGDPDVPDGDLSQRAITCDWGVFTDPILALE